MKRRSSVNAYFVQRIPSDVKAKSAGLLLRIPLGDSFVEKTLSAAAQDIRFSLKTAAPGEVKVRQAAAAAYLERVWQGLRDMGTGSETHLLQDQIEALSGEIYASFMRAFGNDPREPKHWLRFRAELDEASKPRVEAADESFPGEDDEPILDEKRALAMEARFGRTADELLARKGLIVAPETRTKLLEAIARAERDVSFVLERRASGDYRPDQSADRFPVWRDPISQTPAASSIVRPPAQKTLTAILEDWWKEAQAVGRKPSTYESYSNTVRGFVTYLEHDDATRVTPEDVVGFKDHRLSSINPRTGKPISAKTVKDSDLAGLKTLFGWAVVNRRLASNPASGVTIKLGKRKSSRSKGFTDQEAKDLLRAADERQQGQEKPKTFAAKRWVPWLCAYTGARVGEVAQLRKEDIREEAGHWIIHIDPEAGTVKTDQARDVVLHEHLAAKGFVEFVQGSGNGHLFVTPAKDGDVLGPLQGVKNRLGDAAREVVKDPRVQPNHGWRHRFKTVARSVGIDSRIADAIQGHAAKTAGDEYGDVTIAAMALAIAKFPRQGG